MRKLTIGKGARRRTVGFIVVKDGEVMLRETMPGHAVPVLVKDETRAELFLSAKEAKGEIATARHYGRKHGLDWPDTYKIIRLVTT